MCTQATLSEVTVRWRIVGRTPPAWRLVDFSTDYVTDWASVISSVISYSTLQTSWLKSVPVTVTVICIKDESVVLAVKYATFVTQTMDPWLAQSGFFSSNKGVKVIVIGDITVFSSDFLNITMIITQWETSSMICVKDDTVVTIQ